MLEALAAYLLTVNATTVAALVLDKCAAQRGAPRIPERRLLGLALLGGTPGALVAQQILRHKTRKEPFRRRLWTIALVQAGGLGWAAYRVLA